MEIQGMMCCGLMEFGDVYETRPIDCLKTVIDEYYAPAHEGQYYDYTTGHTKKTGEIIPETWNCPAFAVFTQATDDGEICSYGDNLAEKIRELKLGDVWKSEPRTNPNSGNDVEVFVWAIDRDALLNWAKSTKYIKEKK